MNKVGWMAERTFLENEENQGNPSNVANQRVKTKVVPVLN
jgi:hypothetical protein